MRRVASGDSLHFNFYVNRINRFRDIDVGSWPKKRDLFWHTLYDCVSLSRCLQYGISFGNKKPDNVDWDYIVLLSNPIEEGTVQCKVEKLDLVTGNTAGQDGDTLVMR